MKTKTIIIFAAVIMSAVLCYIIYQYNFSATIIGLVNYTNAEAVSIAKSANNSFIKIKVIDEENISSIKSCDVVLINGMGLRIDETQRNIIKETANSGVPLIVTAATNPINDFNTLDSSQTEQLLNYIGGGDKHNMYEMLNYIRRELDKKTFATHNIIPPSKVNTEVFTYPNESRTFTSIEQFQKFYKVQGIYKPSAPTILVFTAMLSPLGDNTEPIDELTRSLEKRGMNVYCYAGMFNRLAVLKELKPDAVINFAHGRLAMMEADAATQYLKEQNIPVFAPLVMMNTLDEWLKDKQGMFGGFMSQSIVVPEIDGTILPYVFFTTQKDKDGFYPYKIIPERLKTFVDIVSKQVNLQTKANSQKKVAIFYYKGPGRGSLTAADMEVLPSLYNVLKKLKAEGYKINNLPTSLEQFSKLIEAQGKVFEPYTKGMLNDFLTNNSTELIEKNEYEAMIKKSINNKMYNEVVKKYGNAPGDFMSVVKDKKQYIAIAKIDFGNVVLIPQPLPAIGDNTFQLIHGANVAPPHTYIAPYLWTQHKFNADAIIHFGTHGSLEFTPGKAVALSSNDWSDVLIGNVPHFYIYATSDVGEGIIAKRRSYATLINHLTPPFMESDTRNQYKELFDLIDKYNRKIDNSTEQNNIALKIKKIAIEKGLHKDLQLDSNLKQAYSASEINKIENFAEEVAASKMTGNLYTMGIPYSKDKLNSTIEILAAEPIAYNKFAIDVVNKKVKQEQLKNNVYFNINYVRPAKEFVRKMLKNATITDNFICNYANISHKDLKDATQFNEKSKIRMPMRMNRDKTKKDGDKKTASNSKNKSSGHPWWIPKMGKTPHSIDNSNKITGKNNNSQKMQKIAGESRTKASDPHLKNGEKMGKNNRSQPIVEKNITKENNSTMGSHTLLSKEKENYYKAILDLKHSIENINNYYMFLKESPTIELNSVINALNGGYVAPTPGGDIVANPNVIPTGRNMYAINIEQTPTPNAWEAGKKLADDLLTDYKTKHNGNYPKRVNVTLWSGAFIESSGAPMAQILYLLGVEPIYDAMGRVTEIALIPSSALKRPRIDVVVQTSGQLRDIAASRLFLISKATALAAEADDKEYKNNVLISTIEAEKSLIDKGFSPSQAKQASRNRIFGGLNGMYGTGITGMVQASDKWDKTTEIANTYINNMGAMYDNPELWGNDMKGLFRTMLEGTDAVVHSRQSNVWGALSLDHVYEFMGGANLAVKEVTGKDPDAYFSDVRSRYNPKIQTLNEAVGIESRTTILNPAYIKEQMKGGASSAEGITATIENIFGWNVMKPTLIDDRMWNELYNTYIKDVNNLGVQGFFENQAPYAMQEMTAIMMEANRKGFWKANTEQLKSIAMLHTDLVKKYGSSGNRKTGNNKLLQSEMMKYIPQPEQSQYKTALNNVNNIENNNIDNGKQVVLKNKDAIKDNSITISNGLQPITKVLLIGGAVIVLIIAFILIRRRNIRK
jgi:cobaltochelatase CobN